MTFRPDVDREQAADENTKAMIRAQAAQQLRREDGTLTYFASIKLVQTLTLRQCASLARKSLRRAN